MNERAPKPHAQGRIQGDPNDEETGAKTGKVGMIVGGSYPCKGVKTVYGGRGN